MSELFATHNNFNFFIRIVGCVRGERRHGPIQDGTAPNEVQMVDLWSHNEFAKFLPNCVKTPTGEIGSRTRMGILLLHVRLWLFAACEEVWEFHAMQSSEERQRASGKMQSLGFGHLLRHGRIQHVLFEREVRRLWSNFTMRVYPGVLTFCDFLHNEVNPTPAATVLAFGNQVQAELSLIVAPACALAISNKPSWAVEAARRADMRDLLNGRIFFKQQCVRE